MPDLISTRPLLDKLGVGPDARVAVLGVRDREFDALLRARTRDVTTDDLLPDTDVAFLAADSPADLAGLARARALIRPGGAIWVVSRKGRTATLRDVEVIAAAKAVGLVDNKVVSFSPTRTALRLVIPLALRPRS